jgi:hypothetical protein
VTLLIVALIVGAYVGYFKYGVGKTEKEKEEDLLENFIQEEDILNKESGDDFDYKSVDNVSQEFEEPGLPWE